MIKMMYNTKNKKMFKGFFLLKFNKYNSLFLINVQESFVNSIKVFG